MFWTPTSIKTVFSSLFVLSLYNSVHSWGPDGHALVGSIAQSLLTNDSLVFVRNHLPWYTTGNISMLASWPDYIIYPDTNPVDYLNWQWSKQLHYADTKDWSCVYDRDNDCDWNGGRGCVDGSIQNYTSRLADSQQDSVQREQALKFLVHFIGDAHQPLHAGFAGDRGGNSIKGRFFGKDTNLHSLWDTVMIERRINGDFHGKPALYLEYLINQMQTIYAKNISDWTQCPSSDESRFLACSTIWIEEDAKVNCATVYRDENNQPMNISKAFDLGQTYYNTRMVLLEQRLIQGGVRLAAVINKIVQTTKDEKKQENILLEAKMLFFVLISHIIIILLLVSCLLVRRKNKYPEEKSIFNDHKGYQTIA